MNNSTTRDRLSTYSLWEVLYHSITPNPEEGDSTIRVYRSPLISGALSLMEEIGDSIKRNDYITAYESCQRMSAAILKELMNMTSSKSTEGIQLRPLYELHFASQILLIRIIFVINYLKKYQP